MRCVRLVRATHGLKGAPPCNKDKLLRLHQVSTGYLANKNKDFFESIFGQVALSDLTVSTE